MNVHWLDPLDRPHGIETATGLWVWRVQTAAGVRYARRTEAGEFAGWAHGDINDLKRKDGGQAIAGAGAGAILGAAVGGPIGALVGGVLGAIVASGGGNRR